MSDSCKAVFLSYASQDAEAAKRICDALRAAGVEVWFDQSELRGGDAWDGMIRKRIKECALFVPVISAATNARAEGYFRLEWKLAVDRSHLMADDAPFLFPIVIGDVTDATARVPDKFRDVQWTRLRLDETPSELGARVAKLLGGESRAESPVRVGQRPARASHWMRNFGMAVGLLIGLVYALRPLWAPARRPELKPAVVAPVVSVAPAPVSAARELAEKARALFDKINSNADDFAVAESLLKRALELDATDGVIWAYSARLNAAYLTRSFERGNARAEAARNHAERAVKLAPESAEAWHALGRAIWRSDPPRAEEALRHALQLAPDDGRILLSLGSLYRNSSREEEALAFYVRAAAHPEVKSLASYDQFLIHLYLRRFAEAERCGRESLADLPTTNNVTGLAMLEIVWHGRVDAAQRMLADAPSAMRPEPRMVFASALAALMAKQADEALRALDRIPGDFINDAWYSGPKALLVGIAQAQAGRAEAARIAWETGLTVVRPRLQEAPNDAELHLRLGELLAWTGQTEAALHEARIFEELARTRVDWTFSSARIYAALGRADEAVPILEKFLTVTASGRWPLTPAVLRLDPIWDKLRDDPRFQKLCEEPAEKSAAAAVPKIDDKSVAVLAFANLSDDKANEYFSDGISEELLNVLAKVPGLKVTARTSSFHFKGMNTAIPEIAAQLGVAYVIEGSVRKQGDKVRITAQLIKAADGFHVWSDTFTRDLKDIFAVQDEIAGLIARNLQLTLRTKAGSRTVNPEAYELLLKGRAVFDRGVPAEYPQGIRFLQDSIAIDPGSAAAWGRLSMGYMLAFAQNVPGWLPRDEVLRLARQAADRAIELDPDQALGYYARCLIAYLADWNWAQADAAMQHVLALTPGDAESQGLAASLALTAGQITRARDAARQAVALDPLNFIPAYQLMKAHWQSGDYVELEKESRRVIAIHPSSPYGHTLLSYSLVLTGRAAEAGQVAEQVPSASYRLTCLALAYYAQGKPAEADAALEQLKQQFGATSAYQVGENYAFRKEPDRAFEWLEAAYRDRDSGLTLITKDPFLENLRGDARWVAFMQKMNLPNGVTR